MDSSQHSTPHQSADLTETQSKAADVQYSVAVRLGALIKAAESLADHRRVIGAITAKAEYDQEFSAKLSEACPSWRNPECSGDVGEEIMWELLQEARRLSDELTKQAEDLSRRLIPGHRAH